MSSRIRWNEVNLQMQIPAASRDLAVDSIEDARDGAVGALVQFASAAIDSHSMNYRIQSELGALSWTAHARLRIQALQSRRNNHGCLAVVIYAVNDVWFTGQTSTRFLDCRLWGNIWEAHATAIRNHERTPRAEPQFGQWANHHRYFWGVLST